MASYHRTIIAGNLGRDPETRYLPSGDAVANFSVAVTEKWKKDGQQQEQTTWYRVNLFGKLAEVAGEYLKKGSGVLIEGRMQERKWQDKDGNERASWELRGDSMQMLGGREGGGDAPRAQHEDRRAPAAKPAPAAKAATAGFDDFEDDIPF